MNDELKRLGGLLETAIQQQAAVEKAAQGILKAQGLLEAAAQRWDETGEAVMNVCGKSIAQAVMNEAKTLAEKLEAPFAAPVKRLEKAADHAAYAVREIKWVWLGMVFVMGMIVGAWTIWYSVHDKLDRLQQSIDRIPQPLGQAMPTAPPAVKKGGK